MLYATGMEPEDMNKPQIGISSVWWEGNPCNKHLMDLAGRVKEGVAAEDMVGFRFNTIGVSDGISMGTPGMSMSLQSRDLIADSIETVMGGQWYDANISLPGCDKNMPGCIIAMGRLNRPGLMVYGGTIKPGMAGNGEPLDIVSAFQSYGQFVTGAIDEAERSEIVRKSCPGAGACGGMYTANTMASAIEALGMSLPYSSSIPAEDPLKMDECFMAGKAIKHMLEIDLKPRDIMTRAAFENAMVHHHRARRVHQRRAAPDRHGARRGHRRSPWTTSRPSPTRRPSSRISSPRASTSWRTCTRSEAPPACSRCVPGNDPRLSARVRRSSSAHAFPSSSRPGKKR